MRGSTRDYKRNQKRSLELWRMREFGMGALVGIILAGSATVYIMNARQHDPAREKAEAPRPDPHRKAPTDPEATAKAATGVYVLQAGSYRNEADADRVRAQLSMQGIDAKVQRVAVDSDVWHRVRIGPITKLDDLNKLRKQLQAADVDALVIRVGD
jgi:cell division protein FtsN